jgi:epoxide hydrolase-like predicted phosphatase
MSRRPAIIFDFGNVVAHFDYIRAGDRLGRMVDISGEAFIQRAREAGFVELLKVYEAGGMTSAAFHRRVVDLTGIGAGFADFATAWADIFWANEPVHRLVAVLKGAGYTLVLGSNTNELHADHFRVQFADVLGHFDGLALSYQVGAVKPDPWFYHACTELAGVEPGDCIFIDDMPENVEGAREAGLKALQYTDTGRLVADLRAAGVEIAADCLR